MGLCASKDREVALGSADSSTSLKKKWKSGGKSKKRKNNDSGYGDCNGGIGGHGMDINENELHRIPGRMFVSGASDAACLFTQQGRKGTNQDAMLVWENFSSRSDTIFCGVFDGHGPYGHMVAKKVRDSLPLKLYAQWKANSSSDQNNNNGGSMDSEDTTSVSMDEEWSDPVDENEKLPEMHLPLKQSFLKAFKLMDKDLKLNTMIDCFCSGSTAVTMIKQGQDLVIGNVGDSRAILGTRDTNNSLIAVQLTVDLKPNLPREAARIQQCKGRVFALQDEPDVPRVWLPNNDSPGLAMARAFGDFCLKEFGLISVPDVSYRRLTDGDEFIVLATDGIWDVLSNKEVVDIIASAPSRATAARALVDCAVRAWKLKFPTSKSDDCAVVCLFLDHSLPTNQAREDAALEDSTKKAEPMISVANSKETTEGNAQDAHLDGSQNHVLQHSGTVREPDEIVPVSEARELKLPERSQSTRSLAECISTAEDEEWSALEGVTRVNSLLTLPRFLSGDKRSGSWRKWL